MSRNISSHLYLYASAMWFPVPTYVITSDWLRQQNTAFSTHASKRPNETIIEKKNRKEKEHRLYLVVSSWHVPMQRRLTQKIPHASLRENAFGDRVRLQRRWVLETEIGFSVPLNAALLVVLVYKNNISFIGHGWCSLRLSLSVNKLLQLPWVCNFKKKTLICLFVGNDCRNENWRWVVRCSPQIS